MKTMTLKRLATLTAIGLVLSPVLGPVLGPVAAIAQENLFAPRLIVNDRAITNYELQQRIQFLKLLRAPGDAEEAAMDALIEDRLRLQAAEAEGIEVTEEQLVAGLTEFAGRANLSAEEFTAAIGEVGVAPETFRDFVEAGIVWREVVRKRYADSARPTPAEIDRAIANMNRTAAVRVLLSEIIIPAEPGREAEALDFARQLQSQISSEGGFAAAAREYSASPSGQRGGGIDWLPLANLPPALGPLVLTLSPGQVSDPLPLPNAVAIFQLRAIEETSEPAPNGVEVDYASIALPNDADALQTAARLTAETDSCDDLYTAAKGVPIQRETMPMGQVPQDVGLELARLDPGETSATLVNGAARRFLMLCSRTPVMDPPPSRNDIGQQLLNQKLAGLADGYLADLRANAIIRQP
jgi:peptidyl-prolyl cis-trans isomerase SurA